MRVELEWKPQDFWIGLYTEIRWERVPIVPVRHIWVCLVPMLPIHLSWEEP